MHSDHMTAPCETLCVCSCVCLPTLIDVNQTGRYGQEAILLKWFNVGIDPIPDVSPDVNPGSFFHFP